MEVVAVAAVAGGIGAGLGFCWCVKKIYEHVKEVNSIRDVEREGWTHIGTVKFMCIYPIDSGRGMEVDIANFRRNGFQSLPDGNDNNSNMVHYDRGFIIYNSNCEPHRAILNEPEICLKSVHHEMVSTLWHTLKIVAATFEVGSPVIHIQYLNRDMRLQVPGKQVHNKMETTFNIPTEKGYKIAFYAPIRRAEFNRTARHLLELYGDPDCHLPNFTSCTMVNSTSINSLKRATGRVDLSHKNFRPQIVFKGKKAYIEENVRSIKIGNLEFNNVRPCTHNESINMSYDPVPNNTSVFRLFSEGDNYNPIEPFKYLSRNRPLSKVSSRAYRNSDNPVFGINFHFEPRMLDENGLEIVDVRETENPAFFTIVKGQHVYAKFNPPDSHPEAQNEAAL